MITSEWLNIVEHMTIDSINLQMDFRFDKFIEIADITQKCRISQNVRLLAFLSFVLF